MGLNCSCPVGTHLPNLVIPDCKESMGQIQKVIFQRLGTSVAAAGFTDSATMDGYLSADDDEKMLISPYIQNPATEPGAARTFGGGNQTINGVEIVIGREATAFTGVIYQEAQSVIKTLKQLECEPNLGVYLIDEYGNIGGYFAKTGTGSTATLAASPIPISNLFVGDKNLGGLEEPDANNIQWNFLPNWSDDLVILKKAGGTLDGITYDAFDYNPLTDLVNQASA